MPTCAGSAVELNEYKAGFNLDMCPCGGKINNYRNLGGGGHGHIWQGRRVIADGVICLGGQLKSLGGGIFPPAPPLDKNLQSKYYDLRDSKTK